MTRFRHRPYLALSLLALVLVTLTSCSGDSQIFKAAELDLSLQFIDAAIDPIDPRPVDTAEVRVQLRGAELASVHFAMLASEIVEAPEFDPAQVVYEFRSLVSTGAPDALGVTTWGAQLPRRADDEALLYWFEATGGPEETIRWPELAPSEAIVVAAQPIVIDFAWPDWPEGSFDLPCRADRSRVFDGAEDEATLVPGFPFQVIREPIWRGVARATVLGNVENITTGIGVDTGGQAYFFPLAVMLWNEVSNQTMGSLRTGLSYCPLTDTALHFDSGFDPGALPKWHDYAPAGLFNSNLSVGIEGLSSSNSSAFNQMLGFAFTGPRSGECLQPLPSVMVEFSAWAKLHPETLVLEGDPAHVDEFDYVSRSNPYQNYWRNAEIRFPVARTSDLHAPKERVLGLLVADDPVVVPLLEPRFLHHTQAAGIDVLVVSVNSFSFALERRHPLTGEELHFELTRATWRGTPLLEDTSAEPSLWTVEGVAIDGPAKGHRLAWVPSMSAFWFAWYAMYPDSRVEEPVVGSR